VCKSNPGTGSKSGWLAILALFLNTRLLSAQANSLLLRGSWSATEGESRVFWGTWTAEVSADTPNAAQGSWALLNQAGEKLLEGTWAAQKGRAGWQGSWAAQTTQGQSFSGAWTADESALGNMTFKQMLRKTLEKDITGSWRSGRHGGNWRLKGLSPQPGQNH
jgi:hypothetical protein